MVSTAWRYCWVAWTGTTEVGNSLAEQVENPADALAIQLNRSRDAILEGGTAT
jgi:hypothetical protein